MPRRSCIPTLTSIERPCSRTFSSNTCLEHCNDRWHMSEILPSQKGLKSAFLIPTSSGRTLVTLVACQDRSFWRPRGSSLPGLPDAPAPPQSRRRLSQRNTRRQFSKVTQNPHTLALEFQHCYHRYGISTPASQTMPTIVVAAPACTNVFPAWARHLLQQSIASRCRYCICCVTCGLLQWQSVI